MPRTHQHIATNAQHYHSSTRRILYFIPFSIFLTFSIKTHGQTCVRYVHVAIAE